MKKSLKIIKISLVDFHRGGIDFSFLRSRIIEGCEIRTNKYRIKDTKKQLNKKTKKQKKKKEEEKSSQVSVERISRK